MQLPWLHEEPFDVAGHFYRVRGEHSDVKIAGGLDGKALVNPSGPR
jgi:hypothetical protein